MWRSKPLKSIKERCSCAAQIAAAYRIQALMLEVDKLRAVMTPVTLRGLDEEASEN